MPVNPTALGMHRKSMFIRGIDARPDETDELLRPCQMLLAENLRRLIGTDAGRAVCWR